MSRVTCLPLVLSAWVLAVWPGTSLAWDATRGIVAPQPDCGAAARCSVEVAPGVMQGQVWLRFNGVAPGVAGRSVAARVYSVPDDRAVIERSLFTGGRGDLATQLADGQLLAPGRYRYEIEGFGTGTFEVTSREAPAARSQPKAGSKAPGSTTPAAPAAPTAARGLAGTWYGISGTAGSIELRADGSYLHNGRSGGAWRAEGNQVRFTGSLAAWNGGRASLRDGVLEFSWTSPEGFKNWFVFQR